MADQETKVEEKKPQGCGCCGTSSKDSDCGSGIVPTKIAVTSLVIMTLIVLGVFIKVLYL